MLNFGIWNTDFLSFKTANFKYEMDPSLVLNLQSILDDKNLAPPKRRQSGDKDPLFEDI